MARKKKEGCSKTAALLGGFASVATLIALLQFYVLHSARRAAQPRDLPGGARLRTDLAGRGRHPSELPPAVGPAPPTALPADRPPAAAGQAGRPAGPRAPAGWQPHKQPVDLELRLPDSVLRQPALRDHRSMFHQYGFNLNLSNHIPLVQRWPDMRSPECKARKWPPLGEMPKASVVIIFYNEPLSTLLRNVVGVLNRSPAELLGEIVLVDDHSKLDELSLLPEHLDRLQRSLPPEKVRLVRREVHNGIVGARNAGAKEARYPILVILDSHAQVTDGWLEPLVSRIHEDRTRVVVPNLDGINIETMELIQGTTWPPNRGSFNWRLTFDIIRADSELDIIEPSVPKRASAIKSPVMPGGLFAMDRDFFFELGAYDPDILFYGAEHVEMSFRIWMCGGSMEINVCSTIGHIYREFDRFGVDPQLGGVNIGRQLDINDGRVAQVWMDEYRRLFFRYRPMSIEGLGDLTEREQLRKRLQCKPFRWFLDNVQRNIYVPDFDGDQGRLSNEDACLDGHDQMDGPVRVEACHKGRRSQVLSVTSKSYIELSGTGVRHVCVRIDFLTQTSCDSDKAARWELKASGEIHSLSRPGMCLSRTPVGQGEEFRLTKCRGLGSQLWMFKPTPQGGPHGTLSDKEFGSCLDNMQKNDSPPGIYGCHGGGTQQWDFSADGKISSASWGGGGQVCVGIHADVALGVCAPNDSSYEWRWEGKRLRSGALPDMCLTRKTPPGGEPARAGIAPCQDGGPVEQSWAFSSS